jgi:N-acetylglucosaminyldiphosphoundecaprenol N-acetyl-beta-D-mannosaminyltransferase
MCATRIDFLGLPLDTGASIEDVCRLLEKKGVLRMVTFVNPQAWAIARRNSNYRVTIEQMTLVLPDGEGVALACRWIADKPCSRISFDMTSLARPFFETLLARKKSLVLAGGEPGVDEMAHAKLNKVYEDLEIVATVHGFGDLEPKAAEVAAAKPDAVIVAMGSPRQEEFLLMLRDAGYKGLAITCGGFFDQYLEADDYYPEWVNKWNLRFAWRLYKEPDRLWRRYLIDYQFFIWPALMALIHKYMPPKVKAAVNNRL